MTLATATYKPSVTQQSQHPQQSGKTVDKLIATVYDELRRIAHHRMQGERNSHTLQTTALVNEAYLRLRELRRIEWRDRQHFLAVAASTMRRVLVDQARTRRADKRGGDVVRVTLDENIPDRENSIDLLMLDAALSRLSQHDDKQARIVELRYFGGLSIAETATIINLSPATVKRKWTLAQTWLYRELNTES